MPGPARVDAGPDPPQTASTRPPSPREGSDLDKDKEILALRHQLAVVQRQLDGQRVRFAPADRAWLAALLHQLARPTLHRLRLLADRVPVVSCPPCRPR
jgi:hypothetical protein